jgi:hypothetical protein
MFRDERAFRSILQLRGRADPGPKTIFQPRQSLMVRRTGSADLPLHGGRVPAWLAARMASLGAIITQAIVHHYGRDEFLQRLAHPFWFQSFGALMGMDWHSSGITTSVIGALKRGLIPIQSELGLYVCGGRGRHSRRTPDELTALGERVGFDAHALTRASRLVAKVDSAAVQDGFDLYLHGFFVTEDGKWTVVQQGMNGDKRQARRYHWHSQALTSFVDAPHSAIDGPEQGEIINLTDRRAEQSRAAQLDLLAELGPDTIVRDFAALTKTPCAQPDLHTYVCRAIMTCAQATSSSVVCMARSLWRPSGARSIFPSFCSRRGLVRAPSNRLPWWRKLCTARPIGSAIPPVSPWRMVARTAIPIPSR